MKRLNNLYSQVISRENLEKADSRARKRKGGRHGIQVFDRNRDHLLTELHLMLATKTFKTSQYTTFIVREPKEREVFRLPYFPDRIVHHAIMNVMEDVFVGMFTADTYSCIKGKGIHAALRGVRNALRNESETKYCLKLDITKFYPSIDHDILKQLLRRKIKDQDLLWLIDEIIDSAKGLPIGNYLSQYLANFYLTGFDHWLKEAKGVQYYFRYADDIVILSDSKPHLHQLLSEIRDYLAEVLHLQVKGNYQVFPVAARGIDFVGYVCYHTHTRLRKSIKKNLARKIARQIKPASIASYYGWTKHADCRHLEKSLLNDTFQRLRSKGSIQRHNRGQNKNSEGVWQADKSAGISHYEFAVRKRVGQVSTSTD